MNGRVYLISRGVSREGGECIAVYSNPQSAAVHAAHEAERLDLPQVADGYWSNDYDFVVVSSQRVLEIFAAPSQEDGEA